MTPADLLAMADVLDDVGEETDSMTVEQAVEMREAIAELIRRARGVMGLCDAQLVSILESPRQFGGSIYSVVPDGKWRPLHENVRSAVIRAAAADEDGAIRGGRLAAEEATKIMYDLFVAASTMPKTGALERLGLVKDDVGLFERAGKKLRVEPAPLEVP